MNYLWGGMILVGGGVCCNDWKSWSSDRPGTCFGKGSGKPLPDNDRCHGILGRTYEDCGKRGMVNRAASAMGWILRFLFPSVRKIPQQPDIWQRIWCPIFWGWAGRQPRQGISAMKELKRLQKMSNQATDAMCDFSYH